VDPTHRPQPSLPDPPLRPTELQPDLRLVGYKIHDLVTFTVDLTRKTVESFLWCPEAFHSPVKKGTWDKQTDTQVTIRRPNGNSSTAGTAPEHRKNEHNKHSITVSGQSSDLTAL